MSFDRMARNDDQTGPEITWVIAGDFALTTEDERFIDVVGARLYQWLHQRRWADSLITEMLSFAAEPERTRFVVEFTYEAADSNGGDRIRVRTTRAGRRDVCVEMEFGPRRTNVVQARVLHFKHLDDTE